MRLIKLKIKNIASLKGEHEINFAQIQNQSPLFAITGETGAGKSSILNSIGLVLYGKVYKSNVTQNDLVTLGEKEGQIELIFQAQGKNYLAFWRGKVRKQNGEYYSTPQAPQRELYTLEGEDFDSPKTILSTKTEDLLNLDFDQFCKCIILNQGEFARFLSSSFTERKEILEKLYPGEMLESLSRELKSELDVLQKQKNDLDIELSALNGNGPQGEDLSKLKNELEQEYKLHESWLTTLESMDYQFTSLTSHHSKYLDSQTKIEAIKSTLIRETTVFNELLLMSQKAAEEYNKSQKRQEEELPGLQELLKSEEALKHGEDQKVESQKAQKTYFEQNTLLNQRLKNLLERVTVWDEKNIDLKKAFQFPIEELKHHQSKFDAIFEIFSKKEMLEQELAAKEERLSQLEVQGKDESRDLKELSDKKTSIEGDKVILKALEEKKKTLTKDLEEQQRSKIRSDELNTKKRELTQNIQSIEMLVVETKAQYETYHQEYLPLETTIKLQSLLNAVEVCLTHPSIEENKACPVCKTHLSQDQLQSLKVNLEKTDFTRIKIRESELSRLLMKKESELHQFKETITKSKEELQLKLNELKALSPLLQKEDISLNAVEQELAAAQKKVWEQEKLVSDELRLQQNLNKTREQYSVLKKEIAQKAETKTKISTELSELVKTIPFLKTLSAEIIGLLKLESRKLNIYLEHQSVGEKLGQEKSHIEENLKESEVQLDKISSTLKDLETRIQSLTTNLNAVLGGKKASTLILELTTLVKEKLDTMSLKDRELKSQELRLKDSQGRMYTLEELVKDIDLHFTRELHGLKDFSKVALPKINDEVKTLTEKLGSLSLDLKSPHKLFVPLKDLIESQKLHFKEKTSELKMNFASVRARLEDWEKRQDKISLLTLKSEDLTANLERRNRLYEVLGKDELRTFVLSLVEENLIAQTNDELQKLCQGRYEIIHQSRRMKLTPEFYILDKFREGGLRKVSTLSGGETFMVSLAMALGLAEMTRGKAEIDSLFIDEGFGTLDQESLEDVLDMLKQIQTRGLMVGIISHVKALTNALPVNLLVTKKQDGTSSVGIVYN